MKKNIKVLVLTKYDKKGASSRLRSLQYFKGIEESGIVLDHSPLFDDDYLNKLYSGEKISRLYVLKRYLKRFIKLFSSKDYDLLWIEKELFPWLPFNIEGLLNKLGVRYIADYDDAIFHNYDQHRSSIVRFLLSSRIPNVMKNAKLVTVCNGYLKQKALDSGATKVETIPTVVDLDKYSTSFETNNNKLTIGWIGTPKTEKYIIDLKNVFKKISKEIDVKVIVIGGKKFNSDSFEYEILPWSEEKESEYISKLDIGIMPLTDSKWEKGKCGYKLIQYMACGKPVIASKVGMNCEIVKDDKNGYLASSEEEWIEAIKKLNDKDKRIELGKFARKEVEGKFSLQATLEDRIRYIMEAVK